MKFTLGNYVPTARTVYTGQTDVKDIPVYFTMEELKSLAHDFWSINFENMDCNYIGTPRDVELLKRETVILAKILWAISDADDSAFEDSEKFEVAS